MKNSLLFILIISLTILSSFNPKGIPFPELIATNVNGETVKLPQDNGRNCIIALAFSANSRTELNTWIEPLSNVFNRQSTEEEVLTDPYNSDLFLVNMYTKENEYEEALKVFQTDLQEELKSHVLLYTGNVSSYKKELGLSDQFYIFTLDLHGNIMHTVSGTYSEEKLQEMVKLVAEG
jgi:hypothetical protein